jgi:hypothetical protein
MVFISKIMFIIIIVMITVNFYILLLGTFSLTYPWSLFFHKTVINIFNMNVNFIDDSLISWVSLHHFVLSFVRLFNFGKIHFRRDFLNNFMSSLDRLNGNLNYRDIR